MQGYICGRGGGVLRNDSSASEVPFLHGGRVGAIVLHRVIRLVSLSVRGCERIMDDAKELPTADAYTNDWYRQQFGRLNHLYSVLHTLTVEELAKWTHQANALRKEVNELRKDRERDSAKIGELMDLIDQQRVRLDKASDYVKSLGKKPSEVAA